MKISCPECTRTVPAEDIALDKGWAKCRTCNAVFPLAELLPGYPAGGAAAATLAPRPFDARVQIQREPQRLTLHLPATGLGVATWGMLGFAVFWLGFIAFWTLGALGIVFDGHIRTENLLFAAFSIPFWLVGLGMLGGVVWMARGTRSAMFDQAVLVTEMRCLAWRRARTIPRDEVQCARAGESLVRQGNQSMPTPTVEIVHGRGSFRLPAINPAEQAWLVAEINDFLAAVPFDPRAVLPGDGATWQQGWNADRYR